MGESPALDGTPMLGPSPLPDWLCHLCRAHGPSNLGISAVTWGLKVTLLLGGYAVNEKPIKFVELSLPHASLAQVVVVIHRCSNIPIRL